jgi:hypothetical protein
MSNGGEKGPISALTLQFPSAPAMILPDFSQESGSAVYF